MKIRLFLVVSQIAVVTSTLFTHWYLFETLFTFTIISTIAGLVVMDRIGYRFIPKALRSPSDPILAKTFSVECQD